MLISIYSFVTECLKSQNFEAYVIAILDHYRALNDLGSLNIGWLMGPSSVIIHLKSYLFICLEDSNILHLANLSNIFLWENTIGKIRSAALENQHQKGPYALFKLLLWTGQELADCISVHVATYHPWQPVPETINPLSSLPQSPNMAIKYSAWVGFKHFTSYVPIHIPPAPKNNL